MACTKKPFPAQMFLLELATKTAPGVPAIRQAVRGWVASGYKGATETTAQFLEKAPDVVCFVKVPDTIPYPDSVANLRYYEPDFVAVTQDEVHHLIKTKGREDIDVKHKDRATQLWCENATMLTGTEWCYKKCCKRSLRNFGPLIWRI